MKQEAVFLSQDKIAKYDLFTPHSFSLRMVINGKKIGKR
jgi:hypothetical protein